MRIKGKKLDGNDGFIDLLWKGVLLVEHKSRGKDLDRAHAPALIHMLSATIGELRSARQCAKFQIPEYGISPWN